MGRVIKTAEPTEFSMRNMPLGINCKGLLVSIPCVLLSSYLWAQVLDGKAKANSEKLTFQGNQMPASTDSLASTNGEGKAHDDGFVIGPNDVLAVNVWKEPEISRSISVRSDGKISLPLVGELQ